MEGPKKWMAVAIVFTITFSFLASALSDNVMADWQASGDANPTSAYIGDVVNYSLLLSNDGDSTLLVNGVSMNINWSGSIMTRELIGAAEIGPAQKTDYSCSFEVPDVPIGEYDVQISIIGVSAGDFWPTEKTFVTSFEVNNLPSLSISIQASKAREQTNTSVELSPIVVGGVAPYTYSWNFGDGATSSEINPTHTYPQYGRYTAIVAVTDSKGQTASDSVEISIDENSIDVRNNSEFDLLSLSIICIIVLGTISGVIILIMKKKRASM